MAVDVDLVLAPVDGSDESATAARYALAVAAEYGARVHALYVVSESTAAALDDGRLDPVTVRAETDDSLDDLRALAAAAGVPLDASMAYGFSTRVKSRHPGSVVLDVAEALPADFVVVPREPESHDSLERAAEYVLQYASQPVLSV
jgi:nucleotide-binding universal stress UspA family protein